MKKLHCVSHIKSIMAEQKVNGMHDEVIGLGVIKCRMKIGFNGSSNKQELEIRPRIYFIAIVTVL